MLVAYVCYSSTYVYVIKRDIKLLGHMAVWKANDVKSEVSLDKNGCITKGQPGEIIVYCGLPSNDLCRCVGWQELSHSWRRKDGSRVSLPLNPLRTPQLDLHNFVPAGRSTWNDAITCVFQSSSPDLGTAVLYRVLFWCWMNNIVTSQWHIWGHSNQRHDMVSPLILWCPGKV
jgi:hypothetical protein